MFRRIFRREEKDPKLEAGVRKTRSSFFGRIAVLLRRTEVTEDVWDELEELLIGADVGAATTDVLLQEMRGRFRRGEFRTGDQLNEALQERLVELLRTDTASLPLLSEGLTVVLMIGVNGVGKTTTIAKLGHYWRGEGRRVMLAAGDTFRAAGIEQLEVWADRIQIPCVGAQPGADPAAVVYDGIAAATARGFDTLIVDTAGRLHTKTNLMEELKKVRRVVDRHNVPARSLLVLDATTGQNAVLQARAFAQAAGLDGIVVTKLDGTAKGGVLFSIVRELGAPVRFIGTGERVDDLSPFDPEAFVASLFAVDAVDVDQ
ncbi:MAG TPA: signal recognition particle-docking protein FtsY [Chloroflexota bacterium]|nr:signal recognition particle-docking protein FtsY [Chloroflexota bacterium]